jgi:hypothetical protein
MELSERIKRFKPQLLILSDEIFLKYEGELKQPAIVLTNGSEVRETDEVIVVPKSASLDRLYDAILRLVI